ncbi:Cytochrome c-type protein NapC [hydrothermal vent metagenome]|uniref:Cytochrome c-type protein NapC n=1 Tax=hydrothermal vent metagenome TaxID=652676 RepID=A0A3B0XQU5_9ZZZZ
MLNFYKHLLSRRIILGTTTGAALFFMITGVIFWGGFNTAMEETNTLEFCIACHEMKDNVYQEYRKTIHFRNRVGIRTICSDCHVPRDWVHKVVRKIRATNELLHTIAGSIDTSEKFNEKRLELAQSVWKAMKESDSRECRNCHTFAAMDISQQQSRSGLVHKYSQFRDKTCIDCHKGIAHQLPENTIAYRGGDDDDHSYYEKLGLPCYKCHSDMPEPMEEDW